MKIGIVFEGGGMRGAYTAGIIEALLEQEFWADYAIGVSAGASNGSSYVSKQRGRALSCNIDYANDPRWASLQSWFKTGSFFGMDFIFGDLPNTVPYDMEAALSNPCEFVVGVTKVETGTPEFFTKEDFDDKFTVIRASCSLPLFSPPVEFRGELYMDGGITRPIPCQKALEDGCDFLVVVLTQPRGYVKEPQKGIFAMERVLGQYPNLIECMKVRHHVYNSEREYAFQLEQQGKAYVITPDVSLELSRTERNKDHLKTACRQGYLDGLVHLEKIRKILAEKGEVR